MVAGGARFAKGDPFLNRPKASEVLRTLRRSKTETIGSRPLSQRGKGLP